MSERTFLVFFAFQQEPYLVYEMESSVLQDVALPDRIKGGDTMFRRTIFGLLTLSILTAGSASAAQAVTPYSVKYAAANVDQYAANDQGTSQDKGNSAKQGKDQDKKKCCPNEDE